jgi:hypothetical protein
MRRCVPRARSEKINSPGIPMASRQRRARMRAALSIALARSQSGIAPRERLGTFTIKRPWHGVLIVLACLSGHADAKLWYYNPYPWVAEYGKLYSSIDEYCAAMAQPGQKFIYSPVVGGKGNPITPEEAHPGNPQGSRPLSPLGIPGRMPIYPLVCPLCNVLMPSENGLN